MVHTVDAPQWAGSPIARLALLIEEGRLGLGSTPVAPKQEFLRVVQRVGSEEQAMKLRAAQLLAWCKSRDVSEVGFPSWTAFVKEMSPWRGSRTRDYLRLVESRLDAIKEAVSNNEIDLVVATRAPRELGAGASRDARVAWLLAATLEAIPSRHRPFMEALSGEAMGRVRKARELAEILIGWDAPLRAIDAFLFDCHARELTSEQILERARQVPPKPARLGKTVPEWKDDPSVSLLGLWIEPTDVRDGVAKLQAMEALLDHRQVLLGIAYLLIRDLGLWTCVPGCKSLDELCLVHLRVGQRSFQRYAHEGVAHLSNPRLRREISTGRLTIDRAMFAVDRAGGMERALQSWLALVRRLGRAEMEHARDDERRHDVRLRDVYAPGLIMARVVDAKIHRAVEDDMKGNDEASAFGATVEKVTEHLLEKGATGRLRVAVRDDAHRPPRPEPDFVHAQRGLLAAADYLLATVEMPKLHGPRKTIGRDRYICQNPRCRRPTLRVHHHHIVELQHGGTDDPWNIVTLCPACHLRGIHSERMSVVRIDDWLVWTWPGGEAVLMHSPVP